MQLHSSDNLKIVHYNKKKKLTKPIQLQKYCFLKIVGIVCDRSWRLNTQVLFFDIEIHWRSKYQFSFALHSLCAQFYESPIIGSQKLHSAPKQNKIAITLTIQN